MYAGMRHPVMPQHMSCMAGLNSLEWVVIARTGQEYSAKEQQRARQNAVRDSQGRLPVAWVKYDI